MKPKRPPKPRPLICPHCSSNCTPMITGWVKCRWCNWQGRETETKEFHHANP